MVGFISFVARSVSGLDSSAVEKNPPDINVMSHTAEDMSRTMTANDAEGVSSAACLGHVVCLATCARVWISSQLLKTKPIVVSVYAMVCCGPYRFVFACIRMLGEGGRGGCGHVAFSEQLSKQTMPYPMVPHSIGWLNEIMQFGNLMLLFNVGALRLRG